VDERLQKLLEALNTAGFKTAFSCQGETEQRAYIAFHGVDTVRRLFDTIEYGLILFQWPPLYYRFGYALKRIHEPDSDPVDIPSYDVNETLWSHETHGNAFSVFRFPANEIELFTLLMEHLELRVVHGDQKGN
jgi:hypothetical protein